MHDSLALWEDVNSKRLAAKVRRGTPLQVVGRQGNYYNVTLPNECVGYVLASSVSEAPVTSREFPAADPDEFPVHASFGHRFGGYIIDLIIIYAASFAFAVGLYALLLRDQYTQQELDNAQGAVTIAIFVGAFGYRWIMDALGGTLGKRMVGLRVVDDTNFAAPGFAAGFIRTLTSLGSGLALGIGYLSAAWNSEGKTWHDRAANTMVVPKRYSAK